MSIENVKIYFGKWGISERIQEFEILSATVSLAAQALHCEESRIAKTLSFHLGDKVILIVAAGDAKIDNCLFLWYSQIHRQEALYQYPPFFPPVLQIPAPCARLQSLEAPRHEKRR